MRHRLPLALLLACLLLPCAGVGAEAREYEITGFDPDSKAVLQLNDRVYVRIRYDSDIPLRFLAGAAHDKELLEDARLNSSPPYDAGRGEALAWMSFTKPAHVDEVRVTVFDAEWRQLDLLTAPVDVSWQAVAAEDQHRVMAAWVSPLLRAHHYLFEFGFDPQPERPRPVYDFFFLVSLVSIPLYVLLQLRMLVRYRGAWQKYAAIPLIPFFPLGFYTLIGLGLEPHYWVIFIFRYAPAALVYLGILWLVKQYYARRHAPQSEPGQASV